MKKLILLFLFVTVSTLIADVTIPAGNVSGIWTQAESPYYIDGEITLQLSDNLFIEPGVNVLFNGHYKFIIHGKLLAEGTETDSILFSVADTTGFSYYNTVESGWHSLRFMSCNYNGQGNSKLKHCHIEYGKSTDYQAPFADRNGGGIYVNLSSNLEISNCEISNNAAGYGGGIYIWDSNPSLIELTIKNNFAYSDGGGIVFTGTNSTSVMENCNITGNQCYNDGGGIFCVGGSSPNISGTMISNNSSTNWEAAEGGGISCWEAFPTLNNVTITENYSNGGGGGISCTHSSILYIYNSVISRNISEWAGGGIRAGSSTINLSSVTIFENMSDNGGGIYSRSNSEIIFNPDFRCNIYCNFDMDDNLGNDLNATYNAFVDVIVDTFTVLVPTEYHANPLENFTFDILNCKFETVNADLYVSPEGSNTNSGLTAEEPLRNINFAIQKVIASEFNPVSIFLANGIYSPSQNQELFPIFTKDYVNIIGESRANTILDAEETNQVFNILTASHSIKNLTVTNGRSYNNYSDGGGIFMEFASLELENLLILSNYSDHRGGGIYCNNSTISLTDIIITENQATGFNAVGGGIYFDNSTPYLSSVSIFDNFAGCGGGIYEQYSELTFDADNRCDIFNNSSVINYGNDLYLYWENYIDVYVDTFTVNYPTSTQVNYPGNCTFEIQNSIIPLIDANLYVSSTGSNENSGISPNDPFQTISHAMNSISSNANNPRNIYLAEGIYSYSNSDELFPIPGKDHVSVIGENSETTIIDGESNTRHFQIITVEYFSIENISLINGNADRHHTYQADDGGAIYSFNSNYEISNVIFSDNSAYYGGAIFNYNSEANIYNSLFSGNNTHNYGNVYGALSTVRLHKSCFYNNYSSYSAAGAYACNSSHFIITNCTFFGNLSDNDSGAIYSRSSDTEIVNTICWNNFPEDLRITSHNNGPASLTVTHSDITGGISAINQYGDFHTINWLDTNIDSDPLFADSTNADFTLLEGSPCVNSGTAYFEWNGEVILDLDENEYFGNAPDMGAYESGFTETEILPNPMIYSLSQNFPNPFNPDTNIKFSIPVDSEVELTIYNMKGQKVKQLVADQLSAGQHDIVWNGRDECDKKSSSGIYFYKVKAKVNGKTKFRKTKKMMMLK
jgi:predicted outer membrane repeat protein